MKKANVTIAYEEEKLQALKIYLEAKDTSVEKELVSATDTLYNKVVPNGVREFIELRAGQKKGTEKKNKAPTPSVVSETERSDTV